MVKVAAQTLDLPALLRSWEVHLGAERKSPATVKVYGDGVRKFLSWAEAGNRPPTLDRGTVASFVDDLLQAGAEASTARSRQLALRRFSAWLVDEDELTADALIGIKPPKLDVRVVEPLTDAQLKALVKACAGKAFRERRDVALVRLMTETGLRAGEVVGLGVADVNVGQGTALVRRGKGGKGRIVPFGPQTSQAIDRYMRVRASRVRARSPRLWLGDRGKEFNYDGLHNALKGKPAEGGPRMPRSEFSSALASAAALTRRCIHHVGRPCGERTGHL